MMAKLSGAGPRRRAAKTPKAADTRTSGQVERAFTLTKLSTVQAVSLAKRGRVPVSLARLPGRPE